MNIGDDINENSAQHLTIILNFDTRNISLIDNVLKQDGVKDKEYAEGELASDNRAYHVPNESDATDLVRKSQNVQFLQWILKDQDVYFQTQLGDFPWAIKLLLWWRHVTDEWENKMALLLIKVEDITFFGVKLIFETLKCVYLFTPR